MHTALEDFPDTRDWEHDPKFSAINERFCLALEASRQIAFDWLIPDDLLHFGGALPEGLRALMLDPSKTWNSRELPAVIHEDDLNLFRKRLHQALKGCTDGSETYYQVDLRLKDDQCGWHWVQISGKVVERESDGRARRMVGTFSDIQERKQAEITMAPMVPVPIVPAHESDQFKNAILTAALDCIITMDRNGKVLSFNQAAEQTFGYQNEEIRGRNLADAIIPPEWRERHRQGLERVLATGESTLLNRRIELTAMRADGSTFPVELAVVPVEIQGERMFTAFIRDISEIKRNQAMLKDSAVRYRQLIELSPEATFVYRDGRIALFNQAAGRMLHVRDPGSLLGRSIFDFVHPCHHAFFVERAGLSPHEAQPTPFVEQLWLRDDGITFDTEIGVTNLVYNGVPSVQVVVRDISERKRAEALQLGQNKILNMVATGASLQDILHVIALFVERHSERGLCSILLRNTDGKRLTDRVAPSLPAAYVDEAGEIHIGSQHCSCGTAAYRGEPVIVADIANDPLWASRRDLALAHGLHACTSWPIVGKNQKVLGTFALYFREPCAPTKKELQLFDICTNLAGIAIESRASEERIRHLAHYDGLTSLPNRFLFKEYLDLALRNAKRHGNKFAVLFLDLDRFKEINDTLGHDAGDLVLRIMAKRLRDCLRHTDKIARMGGDEFYVLIEELEDGRYAAEVARKLVEAAAMPVHIGELEHKLSVSIGIAIYPDDGCDGQMLLKNADKAMYRAKEMGKNAFQPYSTLLSDPAPAGHARMPAKPRGRPNTLQ